jgi:RNA recognition motif-containing protein
MRGFAFVEMSDAEGAQRAISALDKHQFGGRSLTVNEAKPMASRAGGGGGGGFGGGRPRQSRW